MRRVMVRYQCKPDRMAENEELVRAVYEELARTAPEGLRYATFRARRRRELRPPRRDRGRAQPARRRRGVRALPGRHPRALRAATDGDRAPRGRLLSLPWRRGRGLMGRRRIRWSTWSCTPATARARARSTRSSCAGAPSGSMPAAPATTRSALGGRLRGRHRPVPDAPAGVAALRRGRPRRRGHRSGRPARRPVLLEPREGPAGWRSVVATPEGGEIAFWQPKARHGEWGAA